MTTAILYDTDFYAWTQTQADFLRQAQFGQLDIANLIEEIEDMGKSQQRQLESRLSILMAHLLKWQYQPDQRSRSWEGTIRVQRRHLQRLLDQNPSLRPQLAQAIANGYPDAVDVAWAETGLGEKDFPATCPYTAQQLLNETFFPQA
jgi:hypothetical protein